MFIRFVTMSTVTSSRSGCASRRLSTMRGAVAQLHAMPQTHAVHREHAGLDPGEDERDETAKERRRAQIMSLPPPRPRRFGVVLLDEHFLDALARGAPDGELAARRSRAACRASGSAPRRLKMRPPMVSMPSSSSLSAEHFVDVVEPRVAVHEQPPGAERFDVERLIAARHGVADDLLDDVGERDDAFGAAVFIHHDGDGPADG